MEHVGNPKVCAMELRYKFQKITKYLQLVKVKITNIDEANRDGGEVVWGGRDGGCGRRGMRRLLGTVAAPAARTWIFIGNGQ